MDFESIAEILQELDKLEAIKLQDDT